MRDTDVLLPEFGHDRSGVFFGGKKSSNGNSELTIDDLGPSSSHCAGSRSS